MLLGPISATRLTQRESIYLDIVRSLAALDVIYDHSTDLFHMPAFGRWGHHAVIVFFVLSGYVIATVADTRESSPRAYFIARLSRLWSVLLPALVLTAICDALARGFGTNPAALASMPDDWPLIRIGAMLAFLSESWVSIQPLSNGAAWSLCLEFWYYVAFGLWLFLPRGPWRTWLPLAAVALAGHKGLLLFPVWLTGVALHRIPALRRHPAWVDAGLFVGGAALVAWVCIAREYEPAFAIMRAVTGPWLFAQLAEARVFWLDWLLGLAVAAHLLASRRVMQWFPMERVAGPARWCAGVSFAAYLFHYPLLHLASAFLTPDQGWIALASTLVAIAVLGPPAERSRRWWRDRLGRLVEAVAARRSRPAGWTAEADELPEAV